MTADDENKPDSCQVNQADSCQVGFYRLSPRDRNYLSLRNYGNGRVYIVARLERDGFHRLARLVRNGALSAQFAVDLVKTVPAEHLEAVTERAEIVGPRRPAWWDWEFALTLPVRE